MCFHQNMCIVIIIAYTHTYIYIHISLLRDIKGIIIKGTAVLIDPENVACECCNFYFSDWHILFKIFFWTFQMYQVFHRFSISLTIEAKFHLRLQYPHSHGCYPDTACALLFFFVFIPVCFLLFEVPNLMDFVYKWEMSLETL